MLKEVYKNIKAIFFDVDDVLIQGRDENGNYRWKKNIYEDLGVLIEETPKLFNHKWPDVLLGKIDTLDRISEFLSEIDVKISANDFLNYWLKNDAKFDNQMLNLAQTLKDHGYPLYLATNQDKYRSKYLYDTLSLKNIFSDIYSSSFIGLKKPDPEYFKTLEHRVQLMPDEILIIDDSLENVNSATLCGWMGYQHHNFTKTQNDLLSCLRAYRNF